MEAGKGIRGRAPSGPAAVRMLTHGKVEGAWEVLESWLRLPTSLRRGSLYLVTPVCAHGEMTKPPCRAVEGKQAWPAEPRWCRILILQSVV